jgi:hypothetical protein
MLDLYAYIRKYINTIWGCIQVCTSLSYVLVALTHIHTCIHTYIIHTYIYACIFKFTHSRSHIYAHTYPNTYLTLLQYMIRVSSVAEITHLRVPSREDLFINSQG